MIEPGRKFVQGAKKYRFSFNGKENDNEVKGEGNQQDYGMRIYDPRLGRFLSEDPITKDYPHLTPYQFASNSPICGVDQDGGEFKYYFIHSFEDNGKTKLKVAVFYQDDDREFKLSTHIVHSHYVKGFKIWSTDLPVSIRLSMSDVGLSPTVVWQNELQTYLVLPDGMNPNDLPALNDQVWNTFETPDEYTQRLVDDGNKLIQAISDLRGAISFAAKAKSLITSSSINKKVNLDAPEERAKRLAQLEKGRPHYTKGQVKAVWEAAKKKSGGKVIDPKTGNEMSWDTFKKRNGQWDMGHKPGKLFKDLKKQYQDGEINWKKFMEEYQNPDNYHPELPGPNRTDNKRN